MLNQDKLKIKQIIYCLIENAIKHTFYGGVTLELKLLDNGNSLEFCVEDTGCGMTEIELANLFVPFFTTKSEGTGLGLAVSYQIIEEHEGQLRVTSELGKGSCFSVLLPI